MASDRIKSAEEFRKALTSGGEVKRIVAANKNYAAVKIPNWTKILACCLTITILIFGVLISTGTIKLENMKVSAITGKAMLTEGMVRVPDVINKPVEEVEKIAEEAALKIVIVNKEYNDNVEADKVLSQDPLPGRKLEKEGEIRVVISGGSISDMPQHTMPDVLFRSVDEAKAMLDEAGIQYDISYSNCNSVQVGHVIRTDLAPNKMVTFGRPLVSGDQIPEELTVYLLVSKGNTEQESDIEGNMDVLLEGLSFTVPTAFKLYDMSQFNDTKGNMLGYKSVYRFEDTDFSVSVWVEYWRKKDLYYYPDLKACSDGMLNEYKKGANVSTTSESEITSVGAGIPAYHFQQIVAGSHLAQYYILEDNKYYYTLSIIVTGKSTAESFVLMEEIPQTIRFADDADAGVS
jgi:hypothetical protein